MEDLDVRFDIEKQGFGSSGVKSEPKRDVDVHLHVSQRNGKKTVTSIVGLLTINEQLDLKKIQRTLKKQFNCTGFFHKDDPNVLMLTGDHRVGIKQFLLDEKLVENAENIKLHGM